MPWLAILFVVPFLPLSIAEKTQIDVVLAVLAEVFFWLSVVLLGKEVVTKYRRYLHPAIFGTKSETLSANEQGLTQIVK